MPDFYASSPHMPLDQADGLRRMFATRALRLLPLAANPHLAHPASLLDRLAEVLSGLGRQVLVVDAAASAPPPPELARVDLAPCIEMISPTVAYLPARQLPLQYVDTRGCASSFIDALQTAWPQADVIVLHAESLDLARVLKRRSARPVLLAADDPESLKHAYGSCKMLVQRCGLMTYDLLLAASSQSPRLSSIASSLSGCADQFLGAVLRNCALADPALRADAPAEASLLHLLHGQLSFETGPDADFQARRRSDSAAPRTRPPASANPASLRGMPQGMADQAWAPAVADPFQNHTAY